MAENQSAATVQEAQGQVLIDYDKGVQNPLLRNRRYVGFKETAGYIMNDVAASFNISSYNERYIYDVVHLDFNFIAAFGAIAGLWDTFNDTFIGVIVDRTRTRWGKFKPYILLGQIPLTILGLWYWFMPFLFPDTDGLYAPKLIFYCFFTVLCETAGTFTAAAGSGFMATITPDPLERVRLITLAKMLSGLFGEKIPELLFGVLYDLVIANKVTWKFSHLFAGFGIFTAIVSCALSFYFICVTKERINQTIEKPNVWQGIKAIINNKPILMITLSSFLEGFSVGKSRRNYFVDVLGSATLQTIVGIPASPISTLSYAFIQPMKEKFSTRTIWIFEDMWTDLCWLAVFSIGSINKNYQKRIVMIPTLMIEEMLEMCVYGLRHVIPDELSNEAMDYCEWKNGYRAEAMTGVARGLVSKLQGTFMGSLNNLIMNQIGYVQGLTIGTQSDRTKWWIFAMGTGVPIITGALGVLPKFFYPLTGEKRDRMYEELFARREAVQNAVKNATSQEELDAIAKSQMNGEYSSQKNKH